MAELPQGYRDIPEEDRKKAEAFFERGRTVAGTGNYEYAIEMFLQGLAIDPESIEAHQTLRDISLKRKASGGKDLGFLEKMKIKRAGGKDDKQNMLNCEKLLAYDPGSTDHMVCVLQSAHSAGFYDTVMWIGPILFKANSDQRSGPDFAKFIILKDIYKSLKQWKPATEAAQAAYFLRPDDMDLHTEIKNLGAYHTMDEGKYNEAGSFRRSMRDVDKAQKLIDGSKDIRSMETLTRMIADAEAEWRAEPNESGKLMKLVDSLVKTEQAEYENRAIDLLQEQYERTKQFRFRHNIGRIRLSQWARQERQLRAQLSANPNDASKRQEVSQFIRDRWQDELGEYTLWSENYPTDMGFRYQTAVRLFNLERFNDAIPVFQQARSDPKHRFDAGIYLGRSFLDSGFIDEAIDTLKANIDEYPLRTSGDDRAKQMYYWYGRALEKKGQSDVAIKCFSQVAQWDFNYRDTQARVKRLRTGA